MTGRVRPAAGKVVCLPPAAGRPGEWLRFWRLRPDEVRFTGDGRVELPLMGYVRLRLHPVWAPDAAHMAGLFGLAPEAVVETGDGWVLVPAPNMAMAVREGHVLLWCLELVPEVVDLEEMVLGTRHRQWHLFYLETQRYRRQAGYSPTEEGELLYGGPVQGRVPYGCRVALPTRLLPPEEALRPAQLEAPAAAGWLPAAAVPGEEETAPGAGWQLMEEALLEEDGAAVSAGAVEMSPEEAGGEAAAERDAGVPGREAVGPSVRRPRREGDSPLRRAAGAIVRAAASLVMRPEEPEEEGEEATDYLQVTGGVRTLLWALAEQGLPVRGAPAVWARGRAAGMVMELRREVEDGRVAAAVEGLGRRLALEGVRARRVGPRLWELAVPALPEPRPEAASVRLAPVPVGRREEERGGVWAVMADLGAPGGLLLEATPLEEERFVAWWTTAAALALPGLEIWAQEGTPAAVMAKRRMATAEAVVNALYDEVVGRFERGGGAVPVLAVVRRPSERDREILVTLAGRGPEVGCYVLALGEAEGSGFPAWVRVTAGEVEAAIAGGRARLLLPAVEAPVPVGGGSAGEAAAGAAAGRQQEMAAPGGEEEGRQCGEEAAAGGVSPVEGQAREASPGAAVPERLLSQEQEIAPSQEGAEQAWALEGAGAAAGAGEEAGEEEEEEEGQVRPREVSPLGAMVEPLEVSVLGPLRSSLRLERQAARALLALLALREGEIGRDEAAALLEEGRPGAEVGAAYALNRLKLAVKALRRACEEAGLPRDVFQVMRTGQVVLVREWVRCDLWEALEVAREVAAGAAGPEAVQRLEELVRGPLLEGEVFSWVEQETARVDRRLRGLLLRGARRLAAEGEHERAASLAGIARRLDPLDEAALRQELECLLAAGRISQARAVYRAFLRDMRRLLEDEDALPEEETLELARRLGPEWEQ
jgi:DNA-binding SARP family transcriptional activator